jgi:hypothetical protein
MQIPTSAVLHSDGTTTVRSPLQDERNPGRVDPLREPSPIRRSPLPHRLPGVGRAAVAVRRNVLPHRVTACQCVAIILAAVSCSKVPCWRTGRPRRRIGSRLSGCCYALPPWSPGWRNASPHWRTRRCFGQAATAGRWGTRQTGSVVRWCCRCVRCRRPAGDSARNAVSNDGRMMARFMTLLQSCGHS